MKYCFFLLLSLWGFTVGCKQTGNSATAPGTLDTTLAIRQMMNTIDQETRSFFAGDYNSWANTWVHDDQAMQGWNNSDGTFDAAIGWENIDRQGKTWIEQYYKNGEQVIHLSVKREKPAARFLTENTAFLSWKQYNADSLNRTFFLSQETRLMQRAENQWKILTVLSLWDTKHKISSDSLPKNLY